jgi:plastocyanin
MSRPRLCAATATLCTALLATSCFSDRVHAPLDDDDAGDCAVPLAAFGAGRRLVVIRDFAFAPDTIRIARGGSVTWANCEPAAREAHTVTAEEGSWGSPLFSAGERFTRRFDATGSFAYTCVPHPHMRAVIIVD